MEANYETELKLRIFTRLMEYHCNVKQAIDGIDEVYRAIVSPVNMSDVVRDGEVIQTVGQAFKNKG